MIEKFFAWLREFFSALSSSPSSPEPNRIPSSSEAAAASPSGFSRSQWTRYDRSFQYFAKIRGINWRWLKAFALNESRLGLDPRVARGDVSSDGKSYGIMQLTFPTAGDMKGAPVSKEELNDPDTSINWAAKYVAWLLDFLEGDERGAETTLDIVVHAYNCGPGNVRKGVRVPEYFERWKRNLKLVEQYP